MGKTIDLKLLINITSNVSIQNQYAYLSIAQPSFYHVPKVEYDENLKVMQLMDKHILVEPTASVLTMQSILKDHDVLLIRASRAIDEKG